MSRAMTLLGATALAVGTVLPAHAATKILFNFFAPPKHIINTGIAIPWTMAVEKATHGRVTFQIPPKSIAPPPRQFDIVRTRTADMAYQFNGFLRKRASLVQLSLLPLMGRNGEAEAVALWRTYKKYFERKRQFAGVKLLGFFGGPPGDMCSLQADKPIDSVATLRSMKMWSLPAYPAEALKRLGVTVVPGPAVRIYTIVSKGIVDGFSGLGLQEAIRFKVAQYAKVCTVIPGSVFTANFSMFINPKKWASIPKRDQAAIEKLSGEYIARLTRNWDVIDVKGPQNLRAKGVKVITASPQFMAALRKAWTPMHLAWIKEANKLGVDGKAAFDYFRAQTRAVEASLKK
jgi:TRAP-type C4-dicarboxylate transport system substrate-binding protein